MPYYLEVGRDDDVSVRKDFEPDLPMEQRRPITKGELLTQAQKNAIPRTLLVSRMERRDLPDILGWVMGPWIVSPRLKNKIEELEPGVHEFIPLHVMHEDDGRDFGTYYLILLTQALDAVDFDNTDFAMGRGRAAAKSSAYFMTFEWGGQCTLKEEACQGHHLWRGADGMRLRYFCSDELGEYVQRNGLLGWDLHTCKLS